MILVGHGQPSAPDIAEAELICLRDRVASLLPAWHVQSATLASPGSLECALGQAGPTPFIYPLFMTDGWFTRTELPRRLAGSRAEILPPLGAEQRLPSLAADYLQQALQANSWTAQETDLVVAAHGSGRSQVPAKNTREFAGKLSSAMGFKKTYTGFLEQAPDLQSAFSRTGEQTLCLPFFASKREHVLEDLPVACKQAGFLGLVLEPIGTMPRVPELISARLSLELSNEVAA